MDVLWSRAEEGGQRPELREAFDLAMARAVAETRVLAELCLPFVRVGGLWVAAKGPNPQVQQTKHLAHALKSSTHPQIEVNAAAPAIKKLGGQLLALDVVQSFSSDGQRTAIVVEKASGLK